MLLKDLKLLNKEIYIFGITEPSIQLSKFLMKSGIKIYIWDDNIDLILQYKENAEFKNSFVEFKKYNNLNSIANIEYIILCKEILENCVTFKEIKEIFNSIKHNIITEIDFIYKVFPKNKYVGIVGNSGRRIVADLTRHIFNESKLNDFKLERDLKFENIIDNGEEIEKNNYVCCLGIPLFKTPYIKYTNFDILVIYEITNKKELVYIKNIIENDPDELSVILNMDNDLVCELYEKLLDDKNVKADIVKISSKTIINDGISCVNGKIYNYLNNNTSNKTVDLKESDIIKGEFYYLSSLIAYCNGKHFNLTDEEITEYIYSYKGTDNNLFILRDIENLKFVNNIAANSELTLKTAYDIYDNIYSIVLLKKIEEEELDIKFFKINSKYVFFVDLNNNLDYFKEIKNMYKFLTLKDAFEAAYNIALEEEKQDNITILLTPYTNKELNSILYKKERDEFIKLVNNLKE